jgi:TetR/AcrR family transcriptional repressor of lmrAB and yxaGH operons
MQRPSSKTRMIRAALDLLSQSGLSALEVKEVAAASAASSSAVQRSFPGGKLELAAAALREAEQGMAQWFHSVFHQRKPIAEKVELLFTDAARNVEASGFTKGCPAASVTLDIDRDAEELRAVCRAVFASWQDVIATGLDEVPKAERSEAAELILATLEGALILSRAAATKEPLLRSGKSLGVLLSRKFRAPAPASGAKRQRRRI